MAVNRRRAVSTIREVLTKLNPVPTFIPLEELSKLEHGLLLEQRIISTQMLEDNKSAAVAVWHDRSVNALINEEDHIRLQAIEPGIMIEQAYQSVLDIDRQIQQHLDIAKNQELGYLTSCPTNLGTGMRVSLFCHLPGMALSGQIEKTLGAMVPSGIAIRGFFGESSAFLGNIFQISNQISMGLKEEDILARVKSIYNALIKGEREARKELMANSKVVVIDRIARAFGILCNARTMDFPEFVGMLSDIRLGIDLKVIRGITNRRINQLMMETQPAHLSRIYRDTPLERDMDIRRADYIRKALHRAQLHL
jgi:protein arginine kinase